MHGKYDNGVKYYTIGKLPVNFPENDAKCRFCQEMQPTKEGLPNRCRATGRVLFGLDYLPDFCPIEFEEAGNETGIQNAPRG